MIGLHSMASLVLASSTNNGERAGAVALRIVLGAFILGLIALTARKQRGADDLVRDHGWVRADAGQVDLTMLPGLANYGFQGGTRSHHVTGIWRRWPAERFQWHAPGGREIGTQTWVESVRLPGQLLPMTVRPIGKRPHGVALISADRDTQLREFRKYWYVDDIGGQAANVLSEHVVRVLLADDAMRVPVMVAGDVVFTRRTTWRRAHKGVEARLDFLTRVAEAIPQRAYETVRADESGMLAAGLAAPPFPGMSAPQGSQSSKNILGVIAILLAFTWLLAPVGIVVAVSALRAARCGLATNRKTIMAGFVLSVAGTLLLIVGIVAGIAQQ